MTVKIQIVLFKKYIQGNAQFSITFKYRFLSFSPDVEENHCLNMDTEIGHVHQNTRKNLKIALMDTFHNFPLRFSVCIRLYKSNFDVEKTFSYLVLVNFVFVSYSGWPSPLRIM